MVMVNYYQGTDCLLDPLYLLRQGVSFRIKLLTYIANCQQGTSSSRVIMGVILLLCYQCYTFFSVGILKDCKKIGNIDCDVTIGWIFFACFCDVFVYGFFGGTYQILYIYQYLYSLIFIEPFQPQSSRESVLALSGVQPK